MSFVKTIFVGTALSLLLCLGGVGFCANAWAEDGLAGKVLETMDSGGYTYIYIDGGDQKQWVAVPQMLLRVGDDVEFYPGMAMGSYTSPTLGKTFDSIVFASGVKDLKRVVGADGGKDDAAGLSIDKAMGDDAYTIADLYEKKDDLDGKTVVVRGLIYKTSKYKGMNWLRIKDGSGSRKKGNNKLVVTSSQIAQKKDVVTVKGVMRVGKSFGALSYEVLLEDAEVAIDAPVNNKK